MEHANTEVMGTGTTGIDLGRGAQLVESIHQPWAASLHDCLHRWRRLDPPRRQRCYLVIHGPQPAIRRTLNGRQIADLAASLDLG